MILILRYSSDDERVLRRIAESAKVRLPYIAGYTKCKSFPPLYQNEGGEDLPRDFELF